MQSVLRVIVRVIASSKSELVINCLKGAIAFGQCAGNREEALVIEKPVKQLFIE
jgi:hypothetical protein